jgi:hypothetical protein
VSVGVTEIADRPDVDKPGLEFFFRPAGEKHEGEDEDQPGKRVKESRRMHRS